MAEKKYKITVTGDNEVPHNLEGEFTESEAVAALVTLTQYNENFVRRKVQSSGGAYLKHADAYSTTPLTFRTIEVKVDA